MLTTSAALDIKKPALHGEQLAEFLDTWGADLEAAALDSAIHMLSRLALPIVREFVETSDIPPDCLAAIAGFSVEDFDGLEDISVKLTEEISGAQFRLEYYFDIRALIWTIEVDDAFAQANATRLDEIFFNRRTQGGVTKMEILQHKSSGIYRAGSHR